MKEWLDDATKSFSRVYIINIAPTNPDIEYHSPGFSSSIREYNEIMNDVINKSGFSNVFLIDIYHRILSSEYSFDELVSKEDGHHITILAHQLCNNELVRLDRQHVKINA